MKKYLLLVALVFGVILYSGCGDGEDECYTCTLNTTVVEVCESNYEELAARNNLDVGSLSEYLDLIRPTGFVCVLNG